MGLRYERCKWINECQIAPECNATFQCDGERPKCFGGANTSTNTGSQKCEQCVHFDLSQNVYTVECYSCKRYYGDLFTLRAGARVL